MSDIYKPCLDCGEPSPRNRCPEHYVDPKPPPAARGYDSAWKRLSLKARRLQPFCSDCGATNDLQADHLPQAWERKAKGLSVRLSDVDVCCGRCNRERGAARGEHTRGHNPVRYTQPPNVKAESQLHTLRGYM